MTEKERKDLYYKHLTPETPLCVNCQYYYQHYSDEGEEVMCGHCRYPKFKTRMPYDTCGSFLLKECPGGFRLTLATARKLALQEFGTAKGLKADPETSLEGYFYMEMGNLVITINPDTRMSGCIEVRVWLCTGSHTCIGYFNRETLEPDFVVMEKYNHQEKREVLEQWVYGGGPEPCHKLIDEVWNSWRKSDKTRKE